MNGERWSLNKRLLFLVALLLPVVGLYAAAPANLIHNPDFKKENGRAADGWTVQGVEASKISRANAAPPGLSGSSLSLESPGAMVRLDQSINVEPGHDYLFSIWVKGTGRFVAQAGDLVLGYNKPGEWQKLVGLLRTTTAPQVAVSLQLQGLDGKSAQVLLRDPILKTPDPIPSLALVPPSGDTLLTAANRSPAIIVIPKANANYRELATKVQQTIQGAGGPLLPIVEDTQIMNADVPTLRDDYRKVPLILLGRLTNNRAFWPSYARVLDAADGYYPGGDGYVVRTAVFPGGANHLILGGSSDRGVERAVEEFSKAVQSTPREASSLKIPFLMQVELGGECQAAFSAHDKLWTDSPDNYLLPRRESGYGNVIRFYENAMAWYWSGGESYLKRSKEALAVVLKEKAYTHQYPLEYFARMVRILAPTGFFTREEYAATMSLLAQNFWDFSSMDQSWMATFAPPYDFISVANRHQIAPWMSDLTLASFLRGVFPQGSDFGDVVQFRYDEKRAFFEDLTSHRWDVSFPGVPSGGHQEEILASMFRYSLDYDSYAFFTSGNARRAADNSLAKISPLDGLLKRPGDVYDQRLISGIMACYYGDPFYAGIRRDLFEALAPMGTFMSRYVNGVRRFAPGPEISSAPPEAYSGLWLTTPTAQNVAAMQGTATAPFIPSTLSAGEVLDYAAFRSGLSTTDDYLAISGVLMQTMPGSIVSFASGGVGWLQTSESFKYYSQNAVDIARLDQAPAPSRYATAARRNFSASFGDSGMLDFTVSPFSGTSWKRGAVWLAKGLYLFRDEVRALEPGKISVTVNWRTSLPLEAGDGSFVARSSGQQLRISPIASGWKTYVEDDFDQSWKTHAYSLREKFSGDLKAGESVAACTLLEVSPADSPNHTRAEWKAQNILMLSTGESSEPTFLLWGQGKFGSLDSQADLLMADSRRIRVVHGTSLGVGPQIVFSSKQPQNIEVDLSTGVVAAREDFARQNASLPSPVRTMPAEELQKLVAAVKDMASAIKASPAPADLASASESISSVKDALWPEAWRLGAFQRPFPIEQFSSPAEGILDLGRMWKLAEISIRDRSNAQIGTLPEKLWVAEPEVQNGVESIPASDSPKWQEVGRDRIWRPSISTGNYGRVEPLEQGYQAILLPNVPARYIRTENPATPALLTYYTSENMRSRVPLKVEAISVAPGAPEKIFVKSDIWPEYRWMREEDAVVGLVSADGKLDFMLDVPTNLQAAHFFDIDGRGNRALALLTAEARLRLYDPTGKLLNDWNLYAMHQEFNRQFGHPSARHPAGLLPQPASVGIWRRDKDGKPSWVIGRYCMFSFLDSDGKFRGVLRGGSYWNAGLLEEGIDFQKSGHDEILAVGEGEVMQLDGAPDSYVSEPGGDLYYPQVFHQSTTMLPDIDERRGMAGAPILAFQSFDWGKEAKRYILLVRENCLLIYDGKEKKIVFSWVPLVPFTCAAIAQTGGDKLTVQCASRDRQLWTMEWDRDLSKLSAFHAVSFPDLPVHITTRPADFPGVSVLSGKEGLYLMDKSGARRIAQGDFHSACLLRDSSKPNAFKVVASTADGEVIQFNPPTK